LAAWLAETQRPQPYAYRRVLEAPLAARKFDPLKARADQEVRGSSLIPAGIKQALQRMTRHVGHTGRASGAPERKPCAGHPRLKGLAKSKTWMAGTSPAMTMWIGHGYLLLV
jgi:hypothetical protein